MQILNQNNTPSFDNKLLQTWLNIMVFFLAFPSIYILQNSVYFYAFLMVLFITRKITRHYFTKSTFNNIMLILFISGTISSILHPTLKFDPGFLRKFNMVIHYAYWIAIGAYFASWIKYMNIYLLAKWISIGFLAQVLAFYFLNIKIDLIIIKIAPGISRNSFVFNTICFSGFLLYFLYQKFGKKGLAFGSLFVLIVLVFTNGRAGALIGFILLVISLSSIYSIMRFFAKFSIISVFVFFLVTGFSSEKFYSIGNVIAPYIENINPRFSKLLQGEGEGDLSMDKSWLLRRLMVDKSFDILRKRPIIGIGFGNFTKYDSELSTFYEYDKLQYLDGDYINTRSAHNSYAAFASETGILGFIFLLSLIIPVLYWTLKTYFIGNNNVLFIISISILGAFIHMYAIAAITGANFWFLLGVSQGIKNLNKK